MRLLQSTAKLTGPHPMYYNVLSHVCHAASLCYGAEVPSQVERMENKIRARLHAGHDSIIEHVSLSAYVLCDRAVSHQLVRHRLASFTQASTRYNDYSDNCVYIIPTHSAFSDVAPGEYADPLTCNPVVEKWMVRRLEEEAAYKEMVQLVGLDYGRRELSHYTATELYITANLREWRHIFSLRALDSTGKADPHSKYIMQKLLVSFASTYPVFFEDLYERLIDKEQKNANVHIN